MRGFSPRGRRRWRGVLRRLRAGSYREGEPAFHIVDVLSDGPVLSDRPFALVIRYQKRGEARSC